MKENGQPACTPQAALQAPPHHPLHSRAPVNWIICYVFDVRLSVCLSVTLATCVLKPAGIVISGDPRNEKM